MASKLSLGIDVGSTTVKTVITDTDGNILYSKYQRHLSKVKETVTDQLKLIRADYPNETFNACITGSAGLGLVHRALGSSDLDVSVCTAFKHRVQLTGAFVLRVRERHARVVLRVKLLRLGKRLAQGVGSEDLQLDRFGRSSSARGARGCARGASGFRARSGARGARSCRARSGTRRRR